MENKQLTAKQKAAQNIQWLINTCVQKGGIFENALQVAELIQNVSLLAANENGVTEIIEE